MRVLNSFSAVIFLICLSLTIMALSPSPGKKSYEKADFIDLGTLSPDIVVALNFYQKDNIFHSRIYPCNRALMRGALANKLLKVSQDIKKDGYRLKIWAAFRPLSVQTKMYEKYNNPLWISHPSRGKKTHTRGVAVDCTLIDENGNELDMPTKYLEFDKFAQMKSNSKDVTPVQKKNRDYLLKVMKKHGLDNYPGEWWHFQLPRWAAYHIVTQDIHAYEMDKDHILRKDLYKK